MQDDAAIEMMPRHKSRRAADIETDYQPVNWKRLFLTPKYLACWAVAIIALVLTVILTIRHDQVVAQIFLVYLGVLLLQDQPDHSAKNIVFGVAFAVTIVMAVYIWYKMRQIKRVLLAEQAERRKRGVGGAGAGGGVGHGDEVEDEGADSEGRGLLLVSGSGVGGTRERDFEAIGREEADIGVVGRNDRRDLAVGETQGPQYREDFEYQGLGGPGQVGKGAVKEQAWV
ncbi:hypothetical protein NEMBOFW57_010869 [Staphylotrichum longicolle]|uniref:Uncharacterized protein n=1 Tax=Staphylotrichum longicolle TaxID=669026 RepID=A0AAD4HT83_9PEZI|nr:hypothetical protein NEMBOFW57_010869 [Staphylotrichum longicolle]